MKREQIINGIIILIAAWIIWQLAMDTGYRYDRCPEGQHSETYVQAGGAEHDVCIFD